MKVVFDTSPIITLTSIGVSQGLVIEQLLSAVEINLVDTVYAEATANLRYSDAQEVQRLFNVGYLKRIPKQVSAVDNLIDLYQKLGQGERDSIRLAIAVPSATLVLDDYLAFVVANRFGLQPILFLDFLVALAQTQLIDPPTVRTMVHSCQNRYSNSFYQHTLEKLKLL